MQSIFHSTERARLIGRLGTLNAQTPARWGRMSAYQMVCHLYDAVESAEKPTPSEHASGLLTRFPVKQLVIYWLPWPKGKLQSPPDLLTTQPSTWARAVERPIASLNRIAARGPTGAWPASDVFGELSGKQWGALLRTHIDHHFRQFGA